MTRLGGIVLAFFLCSSVLAQSAPLVPPEVLAQIHDTPNPLPRNLAPSERGQPLPQPLLTTPPSGTIDTPAEYEPAAGLLIAWNAYQTILTQLTVGVTTEDPSAIMWVVVDNASEQASATSTLSAAGANMSRVQFITCTTDTVWMRDYGPRFIFNNSARAMIDHTYNRPRPNDDAFTDFLSTAWGEPQYDLPLVHGGGNFHLFRNNDAFMTRLVLTENSGVTEQQVKDYFAAYENVNLTLFDGFPTSYDSTQHIDMWMFPLGDNKVIIGQYASSDGQPYTITENATATLTSRGYTVYRTPGWHSGSTHYTYTNAVILNNLLFISKFGGSYATQDATALSVFQSALPGYTIHQIDNASIITAAGAMHCIVMHVPAYAPQPVPTVTVSAPNGGETLQVGQTYNIAWTAQDDVGVTSVDIYLSTDGGTTYPYLVATGLANTGTFAWTVPPRACTQCRIKIVAHDADDNSGEDVSDANFTITPFGQQVVFDVPLDSSPGWTISGGQWAFGHPLGQGGAHGYPDPSNGATGTNVYGVNLAGDYSTTAGGPYYLTTSAFNGSNVMGTTLKFQRWLNTDVTPYTTVTVQVSNDGSAWTTLFTNGTTAITDNAWTEQQYDISAVADGHATVYVRWSYKVANYAYAYSGWNIDDVQIVGVPSFALGDLNCDGVVNNQDIDPFVMALFHPATYATNFPNCSILLADATGDGAVNNQDIDGFVAALFGH